MKSYIITSVVLNILFVGLALGKEDGQQDVPWTISSMFFVAFVFGGLAAWGLYTIL